MQNLNRPGFRFTLSALLAAAFLFSGVAKVRAGEESPRDTVERLYAFVFAHDQNPREEELPKIKDDFDPKFYKSLLAAFKLPEAGLDFAPFINAQDTVGAYRVGAPLIKDGDAAVLVTFGTSTKPNVKIELHLVGGKWLVQDVLYPDADEPNQRLSKIIALLLK